MQSLETAKRANLDRHDRLISELAALQQAQNNRTAEPDSKERELRADVIEKLEAAVARMERQRQQIEDRLGVYEDKTFHARPAGANCETTST